MPRQAKGKQLSGPNARGAARSNQYEVPNTNSQQYRDVDVAGEHTSEHTPCSLALHSVST